MSSEENTAAGILGPITCLRLVRVTFRRPGSSGWPPSLTLNSNSNNNNKKTWIIEVFILGL